MAVVVGAELRRVGPITGPALLTQFGGTPAGSGDLQHSPADIVRWLLVQNGYLGDPRISDALWPGYCSGEPSAPDEIVTTYDTTSMDDGRSMIDGELWTHYGFQVRIRGKDHRSGWLKSHSLRRAMAMDVYDSGVIADGVNYIVHCITRIGSVLTLGKNTPSTKRSLFTINAFVSLSAIQELS